MLNLYKLYPFCLSEFSDNPGIAALWHDEKVRREWKGLVEDLVALPSPGVLIYYDGVILM